MQFMKILKDFSDLFNSNSYAVCEIYYVCHFPSSPDDSRSSTPKSDSELTNQNKDNPEMLWTWGELPQAAQVEITLTKQEYFQKGK